MKFSERKEIIQFRESSPEFVKSSRWLKEFFNRLIIFLFGFIFAKLKTGSENWHIFQDKLSYRPSVGIYSKLRALFYFKTLPKCGEELYVHPNVAIYFPKNVELGKNVFFNRGVFITARDKVVIGNDVLIGPYTVINSGNHKYIDSNTLIRLQGHNIAPIIIEDDVWIGAHCTILAGVTIGKGAVLAAGSVINKSVEPYSLVAGVPAKQIKKRI